MVIKTEGRKPTYFSGGISRQLLHNTVISNNSLIYRTDILQKDYMEIQNKSKEYHTTEHLVYSCQYHVIFCPKYRRKVLTCDIETRLKELILE